MSHKSGRRFAARALLVPCIAILLAASTASPARAISSGLVPDEVCSVLGNPFGKKGVELLPDIVSSGRYSGGFVWSLLLEAGAAKCEQQDLLAALQLSQDFLSTKVNGSSIPSLTTLRRYLPADTTPADVRAALPLSAPYVTDTQVQGLADALCADVTGRRSSTVADDASAVLGPVGVEHLGALRLITAMAVDDCFAITNLQADGLTSQLTNLALSNTFPSDVTPPYVLGPNWAPTADPRTITLSWGGFDVGGVNHFDVSVRDPGQNWKPLYPNTTTQSGLVTLGSTQAPPRFAVRAVDERGNVSGWAYMTPCLSCN